jgi:uncharacterized protein YycO
LKKLLFLSCLLGIIIFIAAGYSVLSIHSNPSNKKQNSSLILSNQLDLQNGDLIFRKGRSIESQIVLLSDGNSDYSHVGIIYLKDGKPLVIHSVPAENGEEQEFVKLESVEDFLKKDKAVQFAVFRLEDSLMNSTKAASEFAYNCYLNKFRFDNQYDLNSDTKLYCTELIWKAYQQIGIDLVQNRLHDINFIVINKRMIMPSSILESKYLKLVHSNYSL